MTTKIAINGFGRIGRAVLRIISTREDVNGKIEVVAINDIGNHAALAHLFQYDSVFGRFPQRVTYQPDPENPQEGSLCWDGTSIKMTSHRHVGEDNQVWQTLDAGIVIEGTGIFRTREESEQHLNAGAKKVIITAPGRGDIDLTVVLGVNDQDLQPQHQIISNASCTTNCLAPMVKVLHEKFGVQRGLLTTVHAYTSDQRLVDAPHDDLRRARAAACNFIPTKTGAAEAVGKVLPELNGKLTGMAVRGPVPDGSLVDLVVQLSKNATAEDINAAFKKAAQGALAGILEYTEEPLVSSDILQNPHSCIVDGSWTRVIDGTLVKVIGWYDNEWGYANRIVDLVLKVSQLQA